MYVYLMIFSNNRKMKKILTIHMYVNVQLDGAKMESTSNQYLIFEHPNHSREIVQYSNLAAAQMWLASSFYDAQHHCE